MIRYYFISAAEQILVKHASWYTENPAITLLVHLLPHHGAIHEDFLKTWEQIDLAVINSKDESKFVYDLMRNTSDTVNGWIGLHRRADKKFYWLDGRTAERNYEKWHSGEPNNFGGVEYSGYLLGGNHGGTWNDGICLSSSRVALCQWPI